VKLAAILSNFGKRADRFLTSGYTPEKLQASCDAGVFPGLSALRV
jgi:hypothetical protein